MSGLGEGRLITQKLQIRVNESNGKGGKKVRVLFSAPRSSRVVRWGEVVVVKEKGENNAVHLEVHDGDRKIESAHEEEVHGEGGLKIEALGHGGGLEVRGVKGGKKQKAHEEHYQHYSLELVGTIGKIPSGSVFKTDRWGSIEAYVEVYLEALEKTPSLVVDQSSTPKSSLKAAQAIEQLRLEENAELLEAERLKAEERRLAEEKERLESEKLEAEVQQLKAAKKRRELAIEKTRLQEESRQEAEKVRQEQLRLEAQQKEQSLAEQRRREEQTRLKSKQEEAQRKAKQEADARVEQEQIRNSWSSQLDAKTEKIYYYNAITRASVWEAPLGYQIEGAALEAQQEAARSAAYALEREKKLMEAKALEAKDSKAVEELLTHVAQGEQDKAEALLKTNPRLALAKGRVTDLSKREFKEITAFQYALWALDWHMWKMLLKYLDKETAAQQLQELEEKGTAHGKHFSLTPLIDALNTYVHAVWDDWSGFKRHSHWCEQVGGAQLLLPAHVVNEYCHPTRSFDPCPKFTEELLPRSMKTKSEGGWFSAQENNGTLGVKFAYGRGCTDGWRGPSTGFGLNLVETSKIDRAALQSLWNTRQLQLQGLKTNLTAKSSLSASHVVNAGSGLSVGEVPAPIFAPTPSGLLLPLPAMTVVDKKTDDAKVDAKEVMQLLQHVVNGEQDEAEALIKKKPELLLSKGNVTDLSKRGFKEIAAFQYATWALDWHMWTMLLKYLPKDQAALQRQELAVRGTAHGKQVSWQGLITAYEQYETYFKARNWEVCEGWWVQGIGGSQLLLPVHVVNEYCHGTRSFYPLPDFSKASTLPRSRVIGGRDWYDARCGKECAHYRGNMYGNPGSGGVRAHSLLTEALYQDKGAVASLWETRQRQLAELDKTLSADPIRSQMPVVRAFG